MLFWTRNKFSEFIDWSLLNSMQFFSVVSVYVSFRFYVLWEWKVDVLQYGMFLEEPKMFREGDCNSYCSKGHSWNEKEKRLN